MARVSFTGNLKRHLACPPATVQASTVREALDAVFATNLPLRSYILDDQGRLRRHVNIFVNDAMIADRLRQSDAIGATDEIYVLQALSGG
jgi:molybdopterin converting factor small subunit